MDAHLGGCDTDYRGHRALHKLGLTIHSALVHNATSHSRLEVRLAWCLEAPGCIGAT